MKVGSWLAFLAIGMTLALAPAGGREAAVGEAERGAIRQVIEAQLAAFQRDDAGGAFAYASPTIQRKFGTPGFFMEMVRTGYPPVYRPREVEFRDLVAPVAGRLVQEVLLVGPDGRAVIARYEMQRQPDGTWKINGCTLDPAPDLGV